MKKFLFFTLVVLCITSCTTTYHVSMQPEYSKALVGHNHQYIVSTMGAPNRQITDGAGGTILIYEETRSQSMAVPPYINYSTITYPPGVITTSRTDYIYVYINSQGKCYNVKTNLTKLESEPDPTGTALAIGGSTLGLVLYILILCGI